MRDVIGICGAVVRDHLGLTLLVAATCLAALCAAPPGGAPDAILTLERVRDAYIGALCVVAPVCLVRAFARTVHARPARPFGLFLTCLRDVAGDPRGWLGAAWLLVLFVLFSGAFAQLKGMIGLSIGFAWDEWFAEADRFLFGTDPWRLTFLLFGTPAATFGLTLVYALWYFVLLAFVFGMAFHRAGPHLRLTFFYGFFLVWLAGGLVLAGLLASAGPAFYAGLGLGGRYEAQMALLAAFDQHYPVWALDAQKTLWERFLAFEAPQGGISAMPSLHVAVAVQLALVAFRIDRRLGFALGAFAMLTFVATVHLAWHYAVDGIAGALIAGLCHAAAIRLADLDLRIRGRATARRPPARQPVLESLGRSGG